MSEADGVAPVPGLLPAPASQCAATRRADCIFLSALQTPSVQNFFFARFGNGKCYLCVIISRFRTIIIYV